MFRENRDLVRVFAYLPLLPAISARHISYQSIQVPCGFCITIRCKIGLMNSHLRLLRLGAWLLLLSTVVTGPLLTFIVEGIAPQPAWIDAVTFASHYHWLQSLPFWSGFILILGNALFVVGAGFLGERQTTPYYFLALIALAVYASLAAFNYTAQVAYIPAAVKSPDAGLALLSMTNPNSVAWALEMFAYAILGIALWLVAPGFTGSRLANLIRYLIVFDAVTSIGGAFAAAALPGGMLDSGALVAYFSWNVLVALIVVLVLIEYRQKA